MVAAAKGLCGFVVGCFEVEPAIEVGLCKNDSPDDKCMQLCEGGCSLCPQNLLVAASMLLFLQYNSGMEIISSNKME